VAPEKNLIEQHDILAAREVIADRVHRTPVMGSSYLGEQASVQLYFKLELFQKSDDSEGARPDVGPPF
jgi:threonine dehydratase